MALCVPPAFIVSRYNSRSQMYKKQCRGFIPMTIGAAQEDLLASGGANIDACNGVACIGLVRSIFATMMLDKDSRIEKAAASAERNQQ